MSDFFMISTRSPRRGITEIFPKFIIRKSNDLMIRGGAFYAVWLDEDGRWSTNEEDALALIDRELDRYVEENRNKFGEDHLRVLHMWDADTGIIDKWHKYCQKQMFDNFHTLDEKLVFSNAKQSKRDYSSKRLNYPLEDGSIEAYDRLMSVLYSPEERHKLEWAIGSIVTGDSKKIQKFMVLYGSAGTGKSTVLNIIQKLFDGYYATFDAKALGSASSQFALEPFRSSPLVAIQHDGDLSRIEDNTRLNSLVSHELMTVNEKFKSTYASRFKAFLFMGTNKPVKITDAKSGLLRRLIDVSPTGEKLSPDEYLSLVSRIDFELGAIASHCKQVYLENPGYYDNYVPLGMMGASNDFYNFVFDNFHIFDKEDGTTLTRAWEMYNAYVSSARISYPYSMRVFKEELKSYFKEYSDRKQGVRSVYSGFRRERFEKEDIKMIKRQEPESWIVLSKNKHSVLDDILAGCPAQYTTESGTPCYRWANVTTKLADISTTKLHYVKVPENHIVIDFDIQDSDGKKLLKKNLEAASLWPPTYAELSKSGSGVHLHYIYDGDVSELAKLYAPNIEVKVFTGNSSLRRMLTKCNDISVATISTGLPIKEKKVVNQSTIKSEKSLRSLIERNLRKEIHPATAPSIDFIHKILEDAYASGLEYDISDMRPTLIWFATQSTHQSDKCLKVVNDMKFCSESHEEATDGEGPLIFYDVEVFPNLFIVNYKKAGDGEPVKRLINPEPAEIERFIDIGRLIGFNCRRYDNHIVWARLLGYSNEELYELSQKIIGGSTTCFFREAYNLSYVDVLDMSSKKQSLKKFEIELGIHHQELGLRWDEPVPEHLWNKVAEYCDNDVIATEKVFEARSSDFTARKILASIANMPVNSTTNSLTSKIIFGDEKNPQAQFNYRKLGDCSDESDAWLESASDDILNYKLDPEFTKFDSQKRPIFPGYEKGLFTVSTKLVKDKTTGEKVEEEVKQVVSMYRGEIVGEGGYVYARPGLYHNIALLDIASMHPSTIRVERLFGKFTDRFNDILDARLAIKHKDFDLARTMLNGALAPFLTNEDDAVNLAKALKIAINSVYGLTASNYDTKFRDIRNTDNIVAKRGALFMVNLKHEVENRGYIVAHIKTDSIKIPDADDDIIQFVMEYGRLYGYNFEHEATYDRMCLVNDAVYICYHDGKWDATGKEFAVPCVFKSLFSKESLIFDDYCETKEVQTALYLDNDRTVPGEHTYIFIGKVGKFIPIKPECGGYDLLREVVDKQTGKRTGFASATGAKGYKWLEAEVVAETHKDDWIDIVDTRLVEDTLAKAVENLDKHGGYHNLIDGLV